MVEEILEKLRKAGLTGNESKVYFELLKKEQLSANQIAKNIGIDRTLTYTVLNHLIEKGMVNYVIKGNKKMFNPSSPENLLNPVKEQEAYIQNLLPDLKSIEKSVGINQEISVYDGKEGVRAFARVLMKHRGFDSFGATGRAYDLLIEAPRLAKDLEKSNAKIRLITHSKYKKHPMKVKNCDVKYLDIKSEATTTIFGDYVAIHIIKDKPSIILIRNKYIAESYKNHFEVLWETAQK
jgi:sugar-specific transcriptional regulator TrmB